MEIFWSGFETSVLSLFQSLISQFYNFFLQNLAKRCITNSNHVKHLKATHHYSSASSRMFTVLSDNVLKTQTLCLCFQTVNIYTKTAKFC